MLAILLLALMLSVSVLGQQLKPAPAYWTPLNPPVGYQIGPVWLLTDGTILALAATPSDCVQSPPYCYPTEVFRLIPDAAGSYINGTWSDLISMPVDYAPVGFASAVLANGTVLMEGGEHNFRNPAETTKGYLLNPMSPSWTPVTPPLMWMNIGDAPGIVLNDGTFMLGDCCENSPSPELVAKFVPSSFSLQMITTSGKLDRNSEEGWTLLPYDSNNPQTSTFLTVDTNPQPPNKPYEIYNSTTGQWTNGPVGFQLFGGHGGNEIGPQVLRADGTVFVVGASPGYSSAPTGIYTPGPPPGWVPGPGLPNETIQGDICFLDGSDTGAALLPSGNVLLGANTLNTPTCPYAQSFFFEFDGMNLNATPPPPGSTVTGAMLVLPTGQVLLTDLFAMNNPVIYTPAGFVEQPPTGAPWEPIVTFISPGPFMGGQTNIQISGLLFNGVSQTNMFGDDLQNASNYPLVRSTLAGSSGPTAPVTYCRTHDHSSMVVAAPTLTVTTKFDIPCNIAGGNYYLEVVANGASSGYYGPFRVNQGSCN
jgi:hypothetical protein